MILQAQPAMPAASSNVDVKGCNRILKSRGQATCHPCINHTNNEKKKISTNTISTLLGDVGLTPLPHANPIIARHLRRRQACRRRRRRWKEKEYKYNYNKGSAGNPTTRRNGIKKRNVKNRVSCCTGTTGSICRTRNNSDIGTRIGSLLHAPNIYSSALQAHSYNWLQTTTPATAAVALTQTTMAAVVEKRLATRAPILCMFHALTKTAATRNSTTTITPHSSKPVKCERLTNRRKLVAPTVAMRHKAPQPHLPTASTIEYLPATLEHQHPKEEQRQQEQQPDMPAATAFEARLQADVEQIVVAGGNGRSSGVRCDQLEQHHLICESKQQAKQQQKHCLQVPAIAQQRQVSKEIVQQRSWRNLIGYVASGTNATFTTLKTTKITTLAAATTTVMSNTALLAATIQATKINENATYSSVEAVTEKIQHSAEQATTVVQTESVKATVTIMPTRQHAPNIGACKSNCRKTFALTSALTPMKKTTVIKAVKKTAKRTTMPATLFGDILTLLVSALTLHATDLDISKYVDASATSKINNILRYESLITAKKIPLPIRGEQTCTDLQMSCFLQWVFHFPSVQGDCHAHRH
ncbi:uncharacterized protein LOC128864454 [Anastrepha ludens]|uniref:uncharacterized protein LOC128864454 n=1 Tax=Anastrepha ludens TaxID=28586 RepID=UPI0023B1D7AB|nr:uncharacterized protein LOC128864454 [Anastrepha ludens]XP_053960094.1 uncharacterized protein LOC128864454 [Anastrepha ludens]